MHTRKRIDLKQPYQIIQRVVDPSVRGNLYQQLVNYSDELNCLRHALARTSFLFLNCCRAAMTAP